MPYYFRFREIIIKLFAEYIPREGIIVITQSICHHTYMYSAINSRIPEINEKQCNLFYNHTCKKNNCNLNNRLLFAIDFCSIFSVWHLYYKITKSRLYITVRIENRNRNRNSLRTPPDTITLFYQRYCATCYETLVNDSSRFLIILPTCHSNYS